MQKYHVALSFVGEDRDYVEKVAAQLASDGVDVFYDKFEEADLWGKDLYAHLSDIYQNKAIFTVMFISNSYKDKLWTNHEKKSAQARAFTESKEYILPAFFDESVEVPGLLKTTGHIALSGRTPEQLAILIVQKLKNSGVQLSKQLSYSDDAKSDVDFPLKKGNAVAKIITKLKSYNWYTQNPAVERLLSLDWSKVSSDEIFVLGRNLYQCACGNERKATGILSNLRRELPKLPEQAAAHLLNGMFYEVYFDSKGEFRGTKLKGRCLEKLLSLQSVKRYEPSILFIRRALQPYKSDLPFVPHSTPETVSIDLAIKKSDPPLVKSLKSNGRDLLSTDQEEVDPSDLWRLSFMSFTIEELRKSLANAWSIPLPQLTISCKQKIDPDVELRLPKGVSVRWPKQG